MTDIEYIVKSIAPEVEVRCEDDEITCFDYDLNAVIIGKDFQIDDCGFMRHVRYNHNFEDAYEYSLMFWSILHELGHYFTGNNGYLSDEEMADYILCGLIPREMADENEALQNIYFDIESEWNATEWAINWIKNNTELAKTFTELLK